MVEEYVNFLRSEEYAEILTMTDEEIIDRKFSFFGKMFPTTRNYNDGFIISIRDLRTSPDFEYIKSCMLMSLDIFLRLFGVTENGTELSKIKFLASPNLRTMSLRVILSLMYHDLVTNAHLLALRFIKYRLVFKDIGDLSSMWELCILQAINEINDAGFQYKNPSLIENY